MPTLTMPTSLSRFNFINVIIAGLMITCTLFGCDRSPPSPTVAKPPKPVSVLSLKFGRPSFQRQTSASVAPWKTEKIGFEQSGRVIQVIEPNEMVLARGADASLIPGTPLAKLDDERLRIAHASAKADAEVAKRRMESNLVAIEQRIPTAIESAEIELELAETELARAESLNQSRALAQSEYDTARTRASTARLRVASAKAELAQAQAEQRALEAQYSQVLQRISETERNLKNSVLFSSFPGMVTEIHAVPGTFVKEGDPIVTVQMIDPMLIEFEVAADDSRRYRRGDSLKVAVETHDGQTRWLTGMVYTVDAVADSATRTFTVTLHVRNQPESDLGSSESSDQVLARTRHIFPLNLGPIVTGDQRLLVEQRAIHSINDQAYVWRISNRTWDKATSSNDRVLIVEPLAVSIKSDVIPFLGSWNFVAIEFADPSAVDLERDLITSEILLPESVPGFDQWEQRSVVLETTRWMLRAGDVVRVALIPENEAEGFYVPMKGVRHENGMNFIHVVEGSNHSPVAKRIRVNIASEDSVAGDAMLLRIESADTVALEEGLRVVIGGTHYLSDGDSVKVVDDQESRR